MNAIRKSLKHFVPALLVAAATWRSAQAQAVRGFGTPEGMRPLRGFGGPAGDEALARQFPKLAGNLTPGDRENAAREIKRTDRNGDGVVTEAEWAESGYQTPDRFRINDLNGDGTLTLFEHTLRWTQYRMGQQASASQRTASSQPPLKTLATKSRSSEALSEPRRRQVNELAAFALSLYDRDHSGSIERGEFQSSASPLGSVGSADADHDGVVTTQELSTWLQATLAAQPGAGLPRDAPAWFLTSDSNLDGQVQLSEFLRTAKGGPLTPFEQYDRNGDGFVTVREASHAASDGVSRHSSSRPHVIEPERETFAQLPITDDLRIEDIDVQIAIMKNGDDDIELQLIGPDGTRAMLYFDNRLKPWGGGRLFDNTLLDDEAPDIPQRLVRPPLNRAFRPQGVKTPGMQGLKAFYGKPARGTWRLAIQNKSQVAGLLEGWALLIKPAASPSKPIKR